METSDNDLVLILKCAGTACNIGCKYCAEARKKQVSLTNANTVTLDDIEKLMDLTLNIISKKLITYSTYSLGKIPHSGTLPSVHIS